MAGKSTNPSYNKRPTDGSLDFRSNRNKMEFSKKWLISVIVISCVFTVASYVLAFFDKNPVSEIAVAIIQTLWSTSGVSFVSYAVQNSVRAYTSTKILNIAQDLNNVVQDNGNTQADPNNFMMGQPTMPISGVNEVGGQEDYDYR